MENEMYTFVMCSHVGHQVEHFYCNRKDADKHFDTLVAGMGGVTTALFVAYYCPSVGGLVNAHYAP
jgi:hypothetical protein